MFDTIDGLPVHALVVHAVVVLLPLMAVLTIVVAVRRGLRERYSWWVLAGNVVVAGLTLVAKQSGEALRASLGGQIAKEHAALGTLLPWFASSSSSPRWGWRSPAATAPSGRSRWS